MQHWSDIRRRHEWYSEVNSVRVCIVHLREKTYGNLTFSLENFIVYLREELLGKFSLLLSGNVLYAAGVLAVTFHRAVALLCEHTMNHNQFS